MFTSKVTTKSSKTKEFMGFSIYLLGYMFPVSRITYETGNYGVLFYRHYVMLQCNMDTTFANYNRLGQNYFEMIHKKHRVNNSILILLQLNC